MITEQQKEFFIKSLCDAIKCSTNTVFETLSLLFAEMAKHNELSLQDILITMSISLKKLSEENKND